MLARNIIRSMTKIGRVRACCHVAAFSTARSAPVWHRPLRTRRRLRRLPFNPRASASAGWPWMPGLKPQMPEPLTIKKLVPLMDEAGVDRAVIVPPDWPGYRHDYGLEAAKRYPNRFAIMGLIPLKNSRSAALLPTWKKQPGTLGVRVEGWPTEEGRASRHVPDQWSVGASRPHRGTPPQLTLIVDHMGCDGGCRESRQVGGRDRSDAVACQVSECFRQAVSSSQLFNEVLSLPRFSSAYLAAVRCLWSATLLWETDITNGFDKATYRQRITHFTKELPFLSEEDKDWIMGRARQEADDRHQQRAKGQAAQIADADDPVAQKRDSLSSLNGSAAFADDAPDRAVSVLGKE